MSCQKVVNVLAVASFAVSGAIAVSGVYVYVNRDSIIDGIKSQALEAVLGGAGGLGGAVAPTGLAPELPIGSNDLAPTGPQAAAQSPTALPVEF